MPHLEPGIRRSRMRLTKYFLILNVRAKFLKKEMYAINGAKQTPGLRKSNTKNIAIGATKTRHDVFINIPDGQFLSQV